MYSPMVLIMAMVRIQYNSIDLLNRKLKLFEESKFQLQYNREDDLQLLSHLRLNHKIQLKIRRRLCPFVMTAELSIFSQYQDQLRKTTNGNQSTVIACNRSLRTIQSHHYSKK